jgi:hypothetical protein
MFSHPVALDTQINCGPARLQFNPVEANEARPAELVIEDLFYHQSRQAVDSFASPNRSDFRFAKLIMF